MLDGPSASLRFADLALGQKAAFELAVTEAEIDRFAALSGDASPLHMDAAFAASRGFAGRVVHGAYLGALASRLVGMMLPGRNGLLLGTNLLFATPVIAGTRIRVSATVEQLSAAVESAVLRLAVTEAAGGAPLARGRLTVGFTQAMAGASHG